MKKLWLGVCLICMSCSNNPETYVPHIEGYWEIKQVTFPDGYKKEYRINETIDFISIQDSLKGFRKKLKPGVNNTYYTSDDVEAVKLIIEDDSLRIYYTTPFNTWKETVLKANAEVLEVISENKSVYLYQRYEPIELEID